MTDAGSLFQYFTTLFFDGGTEVPCRGALLGRVEWEGVTLKCLILSMTCSVNKTVVPDY